MSDETFDYDAWDAAWQARIQLPPGYTWCPSTSGKPRRMGVDHVEGPSQPDANGTRDTGFGFLQTGWLENISDGAESVALDLAATVLVNTMHEVIEFVRADGTRLANPHPRQEDQWEWMHNRMRRVLTDYRKRWPIVEDDHVRS